MKTLFKSALLVALCVVSVISVVTSVKPVENNATPVVSSVIATEDIPSAENISQPSYKYVAKIWNDSLAIFATSNMAEPWYISNISLYSLTNEDYKKLKDGIYLETSEDISRLLEDFES